LTVAAIHITTLCPAGRQPAEIVANHSLAHLRERPSLVFGDLVENDFHFND